MSNIIQINTCQEIIYYFKIYFMTNFIESDLIPFALKIIKNKPQGIETKDLLLEAKQIGDRCRALEALYQSYIFDDSTEPSKEIH